MALLYLDFETKSTVDLKAAGAEVYARHPSTDILCVGLAYENSAAMTISPKSFFLVLETYILLKTSDIVISHNAAFELAIWNNVGVKKYGWPQLDPKNVRCTMAMCYALALPGALADAAPASGMNINKDSIGHRVMLQISQPRKVLEGDCPLCDHDVNCSFCFGSGQPVLWWNEKEDPEKFQQLYDYCKRDVEVERELYKRLLKLSPFEQKVWELDQKINSRGVKISEKAVKVALQMIETEAEYNNKKMREITEGGVATVTANGQLKDWLNFRLSEEPGILAVEGVGKADVSALLEYPKLPDDVREALLLRQSSAKSSTAKIKAMWNGACEDFRLRGMFQYWGAGQTGRFAGRRVQFQNMVRSKLSEREIETVFRILEGVA